MRLWSYQAVAHGADTVMFFQMKRSIGACEKYHGAVIDHVGNENTRVFREVSALGAELDTIGDLILGARTPAKAAIYFDWENWWAMEYSAGPSVRLHYVDEILKYYTAFNSLNIPVDFIGAEDDLSVYHVVVAPVMYMVKDGYDEKIRSFVQNGGSFLTTFFSGYVDKNDLVTVGGYPGKLRDILGIWVEEEDALPEGVTNSFVYNDITYPAEMICDLLHTETAESYCGYESDFYKGMPAITQNNFGKGKAYYVATASNEEFYENFIKDICKKAGVEPFIDTPRGVEATLRENANGVFLFLLNHTDTEQSMVLDFDGTDIIRNINYKQGDTILLQGKDVVILQKM